LYLSRKVFTIFTRRIYLADTILKDVRICQYHTKPYQNTLARDIFGLYNFLYEMLDFCNEIWRKGNKKGTLRDVG
jgi:hypothetical protein